MNIVRLAINKPVGVTVGVMLLVMFGLIGLGAIPVQLTPTVDRPIVTVTTSWPGRSPQEIVDEITKEQEEQLKSLENLDTMFSVSSEGQSEITLEFFIGANIDRAVQEVSDKLRQVPEYPEEVDEPVVDASGGDVSNAIAWIILDIKPEARERHPGFDITTLFDAVDKEVKPFLERTEGVAEVNIYGGREREAQVLIDHEGLARRDLTIGDVITALRAENENTSGGTIAEGKRDYRVRVVGRFRDASQVLDTVIAYRDGKPVYVRDVATVEIGNKKARGFVRSLGVPAMAINVTRKTGSNVMEVMDGLKARLAELETTILPNLDPQVGPDLRLRQVYDETIYISSAIDLVTQNLWVGGLIAALVLLLFLRSFVATGVVALAIPISVIGTFLVLLGLGRTLNVISLAGLAFAVGMVVDNAIVVLENIDRHRRMGEPALVAAYRGGQEVWGAILASTLTTVAVFVPVLTIQEEAGQLFRDIALAIVASVSLSLFVSITVIPSACARWLPNLGDHRGHGRLRTAWEELFGLAPLAARGVRSLGDMVKWSVTGWRAWTVRPALILVMTAASLIGAALLAPPMDYLPAGNRNLVFGVLLVPPGLSVEERADYATRIESIIGPYAQADIDDPAEVAALPPIKRGWGGGPGSPPPFDPVPIDNFFIGAFGTVVFVGATSQDEEVVIPVGTLLTNAMNTIPDAYGFAQQSSLFGRGASGGGTIDIEVSGPSLPRVIRAAEMIQGLAGAEYGFQRLRPDPGNFAMPEQEMQVELTRAGRELGVSNRDLGVAVRSLFDGAFAGDLLINGDAVDLVVLPKNGRLSYKEQMADIPVATPAGRVVPLDVVVQARPGLAPQAIRRIEELPSVTISIPPPEGQPLEQAMADLEEKVIEPTRAAGLLDGAMRVRLKGTAAKLDDVKAALFGSALDRGPGAGGSTFARVTAALAAVLGIAGVGVAVFGLIRAVRQRRGLLVYGAAGALLLASIIAILLAGFGASPELATARAVWALAVTYLLMCALFESFVYPFVIMFSVPLAVVGGFIGLRIVHDWTMADPTKAPQQLDVLTMLGFIILVGVVVNNAILLVHQALNFMRGVNEEGEAPIKPMTPDDAIAESVRTRVRPILMSTLTSVGGMLPLVLFPGAGSEMYRGLGSVVVGGLLVSTVFTLLLVPMMFSLVVQMSTGARAIFAPAHAKVEPAGVRTGPTLADQLPSNGRARPTERPDLQKV